MKIVNRSGNKRIEIICKQANELIHSPAFYEKMWAIPSFRKEFTSEGVNGAYVINRLRTDPSEIEVFLYTTKNPWSVVNGYTLNDGKQQMFLNTRSLGRSDASIVATIIHEAVHLADNNDFEKFYHHGDNYPKGGTAPEVAADVTYFVLTGMISEVDSSVENNSNKGVQCFRSWRTLWVKKCWEVEVQ
jgi:hypothetical protein